MIVVNLQYQIRSEKKIQENSSSLKKILMEDQ